MEPVEISETGELKLDIMKLPINCVLIISEGRVKMGELPPYAETRIKTHGGKVKHVNFDEGEEF
ncbi:hypothetical protein QOZ98_000519 [Planomicrobium stackebrandtii]|uniref:Uncharacterized protein n=1 Tax=Planomicrobium stackebrandtii TaxID=253160 RepID=A0ABU0GQR8_9BACL|nr:XtrA/YqaO family protein [Planomicrobium stackebrandtii]MDQ0427694.1 hypothetical protein [Planomicrobium stackebrandtii]